MEHVLPEMKKEMENELLTNILPFWIKHTRDMKNGGFYGKIHNDLLVDTEAHKGGVLNARILWTYSAAARLYGKPEYLEMAQRAFRYICDFLWDKENGGVFWSVDCKGNPVDTRKQTYAQAFAVYAFSEYYRVSGLRDALDMAVTLFNLVERYSFDPVYKGYFEACDRQWQPKDFYLDGKCASEKKSMNTMLHIIEAYANLYRVWQDEQLKIRLAAALEVVLEHVVDSETGHFKLFFDEKWNSLKDEYSYGHDIEGSWLLYEAAGISGDKALLEKTAKSAILMADATLVGGMDTDGGILYEGGPQGVKDADRHWWPQAEGIVGFVNAWQLTERQEFLDAAGKVWRFTKEKMIDREKGEWFWGVTQEGVIMESDKKVDLWKCPYHNGRACMEIIERGERYIR